MTNHEEYKKAFRHVRPSREITMEDLEMNKQAYIRGKVLTIVGSVAGAVILSGGVCYAANVGGIQETVQLWLHGNQVEATVESSEDVPFTVTYEDEEGIHEFGGGGMSEDENGEMRPISMEEYIEYLQNESIDVEMKEDGSCWLYGGETAMDITDLFNVCETSIEVDGKTKWVRIEKDADGGYSVQTADSPFVAVSEEELEEMYQHLNADYEGEETVVEYNMTVDDGE
ncbi:MAG: hypothetical protein IKF16_07860 [Lachnospiraceae bacterium]|nr:hypothetical protein [Lachnospiraceae bacterium]